MLTCCAFTPDSVFKLVMPNGSEPTWQTSMLYSDIVHLIYVNKTICMVTCLSTRFKSVILWPGMNYPCQDYPKIRLMDKGPGAILSFKTSLSFINRLLVTVYGEGNGNPLQCSCLENPRDRGAWWAAVYGVVQGQTGLKWLSSSSSLLMEERNVFKTQNGTRPLIHKMHFGIILAPDDSSQAIKQLTWNL